MAPSRSSRCAAFIAAYSKGASTSVDSDLSEAQARRAELLVQRSKSKTVLALPDPVGTGKTVVALTAAAILLEEGTVQRVLVVAPNAVVQGLWVARAKHLNEGSLGTKPFRDVRKGQPGLRWKDGELRVVTRGALAANRKPDDSQSLVIVDEAHRGLQNRGSFYNNLDAWVADQRTFLVTATPFQLSTSGVLTMLAVGGGKELQKSEPAIRGYGTYLVRLARHCAVMREEGNDAGAILADPKAQELVGKGQAAALAARDALESFVLPPDKYVAKLPHHPKLLPLGDSSASGAVTPTLIELGNAGLAHHVARTVPELLKVGKGDMFNRQIVSSSEGFWASTAGKQLKEGTDSILSEASVMPSAAKRLSEQLETDLGNGGDHPKVKATTKWASDRLREKRHVLVFCVFAATRQALYKALIAELGEDRVAAPAGDKVPKTIGDRFRTEPKSPQDALVLILQDRFSESIDLDGGKPCLVHHDLPWNPARLSQRWGRAVRASSGFQAISAQDIFVPVLDTEVDRRLYETVCGRWEVGDLLLPKKAGYDENDDGSGVIPAELLRGLAEIWHQR